MSIRPAAKAPMTEYNKTNFTPLGIGAWGSKAEKNDLQNQIQSLQDQIGNLRQAVTNKEGEIKLLNEKNKHLENEVKRLENDNKQLETDYDETFQKMKKMKDQFISADSYYEAFRALVTLRQAASNNRYPNDAFELIDLLSRLVSVRTTDEKHRKAKQRFCSDLKINFGLTLSELQLIKQEKFIQSLKDFLALPTSQEWQTICKDLGFFQFSKPN